MFVQLLNLFVKIIETGSYTGIFFLMTLESMIAPVPSEAVMPFAGFLLFLNKMSLIPIIISSTLGSIFGSSISYYIGFFGGRPLIKKFGRYLLLNEEHLALTENFFNRFGAKTIFFSRFIPIVRHLISIPAGIGKMNLLKFIIYTAVGAGLWNSFLMYLGFYLGNNWSAIGKYSEIFDIILIVLAISFVVFYCYKRCRNRLKTKRP